MDISVCQVANTGDGSLMTIATEWSDDESINVTVLRIGTVPLRGETSVEHQLRDYPRAGIPRDRAIANMRKELSGKDEEAKFALVDSRLVWKKKAWRKGSVDLRPAEDVVALGDASLRWLNELARLGEAIAKRRREDDDLQENNKRLIEKLSAEENLKKKMEDTLYAKFLMILNEKKKRIRFLENSRTENCNREQNAYDEDTDEHSSDDFPDAMNSPGVEKKKRLSSPGPVDSKTSNAAKLQLGSCSESELDSQ